MIYILLAVVILLISIGIFLRWTYREKLLEAAIRDPLTGLHTRLYMRDWCDAIIRAHERNPTNGFGLIIFDLDRFKAINDAHGHLFGDKVLKRVGQIIRSSIRPDDLAVRFGGEELAVFIQGGTETETAAIAERIQRRVAESEFQNKSGRVPVTLSGGVAWHVVGEKLDALFARADTKLYKAKSLGRNRVCV
jgi:diguanylate cyclase (GGDEF)-like protein